MMGCIAGRHCRSLLWLARTARRVSRRDAFLRNVIPLLLFLAVRGFPADRRPVKIDIQAEWQTMRAGEPVPIRIRLMTASNEPAAAPKRLDVALQARLPSREVKPLRSVTFEAGEMEKAVSITPPGSGVIYIWAKQAELLPGGIFVVLRLPASSPPPAPQAPANQNSRPPQQSAVPAPASAKSPQPSTTAVPPPLIPVRSSVPELALRYSPDRRFLADGRDAATVQAFLLGEATSNDIRLNLFDSSGTMKPVPLTIRGGQDAGQAAVTFNQPGTVTVEFMGSEPAAKVNGDRKLQISFMPAITHVALEASPPAISLIDTADLVLTLRDSQERPVASDVARHVTFTIGNGRGGLTRQEADMAAGQFEVRTSFQPEGLGQVEILAGTPNLLTTSIRMQVSAPIVLLVFSLFGGLAGGYLSYWKHKRSGRRQIVLGGVTGFLFYWACLFLGLASLAHAVVVNPLSAFALSTFGGWMQTGVFTFWKARLKPQ